MLRFVFSKKNKLVCLLAALVSVSALASDVSDAALGKLKVGKTTMAETRTMMGLPLSTSPDGNVLTYASDDGTPVKRTVTLNYDNGVLDSMSISEVTTSSSSTSSTSISKEKKEEKK